MTKLILSAVLAAGLAACAGGGYDYDVNAAVSSNGDMVEVSPGVYAVEGYDQPLFYANNTYWLYTNNGWYTSPRYNGGWRFEAHPPRAVLHIHQPYAWVHHRHGDRYRAYNHRYRDHR
jgi:hypothetical protein